jgi:hypothetical protein
MTPALAIRDHIKSMAVVNPISKLVVTFASVFGRSNVSGWIGGTHSQPFCRQGNSRFSECEQLNSSDEARRAMKSVDDDALVSSSRDC